MSAEDVAQLAAYLRAGAIHTVEVDDLTDGGILARPVAADGLRSSAVNMLDHLAATPDGLASPVIDATALARNLTSQPEFNPYDDFPSVAPPWLSWTVGWRAVNGTYAWAAGVAYDAERSDGPAPAWDTENDVDWDRVRWVTTALLFYWQPGVVGALGPLLIVDIAVYPDGEPADVHWTNTSDAPPGTWDIKIIVLLACLNFLACRNVDIVEPARPRPQRRRLERLGVAVSELNVFPVGRYARTGAAASPSAGGTPLTSVRGHFACYGPRYGRRLLFGRYEGRYWRAQHARGHADAGTVAEQRFTLHPEEASHAR